MKRMELAEFKDRIAAGKMTRREMNKVLASVGVLTVSTPMLSQPAAAESSIQVFTWSGYDVEQLRPGFDEQYGAPGYLLYADNDEAIEKVRAGYVPTVVQPTSYLIGRWRDAGLVKQIDTSRLSNWGNVFDQLKSITGISYEGETWGAPLPGAIPRCSTARIWPPNTSATTAGASSGIPSTAVALPSAIRSTPASWKPPLSLASRIPTR